MARRINRVNVDWQTPDAFMWEHVQVEVLMDIGIPSTLRGIQRKLPTPPKVKK